MTAPAALLVTLGAILADPALSEGARGARKLAVTSIIDKSEEEANLPVWTSPKTGEKCPVVVTPDWEIAVFNQDAKRDRHYHAKGTEIYMALEGKMVIEVDGVTYTLFSGDMLIVSPMAIHEVLPGYSFTARVVTVNAGGLADKFIV